MKLYGSKLAPNPLRVEIFLKEKGIFDKFEIIDVELANGTKSDEHLARNPFGQLPVLEMDDGNFISESRAICSYIEALFPNPNLMGIDNQARALIEMYDRQIELNIFYPIAQWVRHSHSALAKLEKPQVQDWAISCESKAKTAIGVIDNALKQRQFVAGDNFTIADITLHCAINFARLVKYQAWKEFENIDLWRQNILTRPAFGA